MNLRTKLFAIEEMMRLFSGQEVISWIGGVRKKRPFVSFPSSLSPCGRFAYALSLLAMLFACVGMHILHPLFHGGYGAQQPPPSWPSPCSLLNAKTGFAHERAEHESTCPICVFQENTHSEPPSFSPSFDLTAGVLLCCNFTEQDNVKTHFISAFLGRAPPFDVQPNRVS